MPPYRLIYIGTGNFIPTESPRGTNQVLQALIDCRDFEIPFVLTGSAKVSDRKLRTKVSEIKRTAMLNNKIVHEVDRLSEVKQKIVQAQPHFILVVSYGEIIAQQILDIPSVGSINIHPSLLPKYRGPSPIQQTIIQGETETGISWIKMGKKMDSGDIIAAQKIVISADDTSITLSERLSRLAAGMTPDVLRSFARSPIGAPQDDSKATYTRRLQKKDGALSFVGDSATTMCRKIRAYAGWPGCYFFLNRRRCTLIDATEIEHKISSGQVFALAGELIIGTAKNALLIKTIQPEGKRVMSSRDFLNGLKDVPDKVD